MKRTLRNIAGILLVVTGVIAGPIPILQGWIFVIAGISLIDHPWKHRMHVWFADRSKLYRRISLAYFRMRRKLRDRRRK